MFDCHLLIHCVMHKQVLQHIVNGLISYTFKPEDLQCSFFHYVVRELLACAVLRPVLNLVNPRYLRNWTSYCPFEGSFSFEIIMEWRLCFSMDKNAFITLLRSQLL